MNTCEYFNPNSTAQDHDGVEENAKFDYEGEFPFHVCLNPRQNTEGGLGQCGFAAEQPSCPIYSERKSTLLAQATDDDNTFQLVSHLTAQSIRRYTLLHNDDVIETRTVHEDPDAQANLRVSFEEAAEIYGLEIEEVDSTETTSYLEKVTLV